MARETTKIRITDDETIAQINPINKKIVDQYLRNLATKSSIMTVRNYRSDFNIFFCWNVKNNDNKSIIDIRKSEIVDFFNYTIGELKWSSNRENRCHSALNSLGRFIENILDDDYPNYRNLFPKIDRLLKSPVRQKTILRDVQLSNLLPWVRENRSIQEYCFLMLAINSGMRISELCRIKVSMIDENNTGFNGLFLKTTEKVKCKGRGKDGYMDYKYILKDTFLPAYKEWIKERAKILKELKVKDHDYLFINVDGSPISVSRCQRWKDGYSNYLTYLDPSNEKHKKIDFYFHCCRHRTVTEWVRAGLSYETITAIMGWHTSEMVKVYDDTSRDEKEYKDLGRFDSILRKEIGKIIETEEEEDFEEGAD